MPSRQLTDIDCGSRRTPPGEQVRLEATKAPALDATLDAVSPSPITELRSSDVPSLCPSVGDAGGRVLG